MASSYIGPKAKALAVFLRYGVKISERGVKNLFEKAFDLNIVHSSITGFRDQLRRAGSPLYEALKKSLRCGSFIHADETGWNVDGKNHWLWKFSNKKVCVSHIDRSRGQKVVEEVIGSGYEGIIISDFLSAYNKIGATLPCPSSAGDRKKSKDTGMTMKKFCITYADLKRSSRTPLNYI